MRGNFRMILFEHFLLSVIFTFRNVLIGKPFTFSFNAEIESQEPYFFQNDPTIQGCCGVEWKVTTWMNYNNIEWTLTQSRSRGGVLICWIQGSHLINLLRYAFLKQMLNLPLCFLCQARFHYAALKEVRPFGLCELPVDSGQFLCWLSIRTLWMDRKIFVSMDFKFINFVLSGLNSCAVDEITAQLSFSERTWVEKFSWRGRCNGATTAISLLKSFSTHVSIWSSSD